MKTILTKCCKHKLVVGSHFLFALFIILNITNQQTVGANFSLSPKINPFIEVGRNFSVDVIINTTKPINAMGATITFDRNQLEISEISKTDTIIDLWSENPKIKFDANNDLGEIKFSGGSTKTGGFWGKGKLITITFTPKTWGEIRIDIKDALALAHDGMGTNIVKDIEGVTYFIADGASINKVKTINFPSSDLNKDGVINIIDLSIIATSIFKDYNSGYDLNMDGEVDITDLLIILSYIL